MHLRSAMEPSVSPPGASKQAGTRRPCTGNSVKDLCLVSKQGSIAEVESALALIKKNGGSIDSRNAFGLGALHLATWRNHLPIVRRLLDAGANPDARVCTTFVFIYKFSYRLLFIKALCLHLSNCWVAIGHSTNYMHWQRKTCIQIPKANCKICSSLRKTYP